MRTDYLRYFAVQPVVMTMLAATSLSAGEPSLAELKGLAPVISSADATCRSVALAGCLRTDRHSSLKFRAFYKAPDRHALLIVDGADGTPLLFAADNKLFLYDPVEGVVHFSDDARTDLAIVFRNRSLSFSFLHHFKEHRRGSMLVDVKSLLQDPAYPIPLDTSTAVDQVEPAGNRRYKVVRTFEGSKDRVSARVDLDLASPYTAVELFVDGDSEPVFSVDKIAINGPLRDDDFAFPAREDLARGLVVKDVEGVRIPDSLSGAAMVAKACHTRSAIDLPRIRDSLRFPGHSNIDWEKLGLEDRQASKKLKDVMSSHRIYYGF
jgi:hypothetical protein